MKKKNWIVLLAMLCCLTACGAETNTKETQPQTPTVSLPETQSGETQLVEETTPETETRPVEETAPEAETQPAEDTSETEESLVELKEYMGYVYWEENGTVTIEGYTGDDSALDIPAEIEGKPVVEIGMNAFIENTNLVSVTIPDSVTILNVGCFGYCTNLKNVTLGNQVLEISGHAFCDTAIEQITLPDSVACIGDNAFSGTKISEISIPPAVDSLSLRCLAETNLEHITVPGNVKTICRIAFKGNQFLKTVLIEEGVEKIDEEFLNGCNSLKSIAIPASVTDLSEKALDGCTPGTGKLKIYVVAGSVAESIINENYADKEYFEIITLENMDNIETIMEADKEATDNEAEVTQRYYVKLISAENDKVMAIKLYRDYTGEGLKESKEKVDSAPCILIETASEETAKELLEQLQQYDVIVDPDIYTPTINGAE